jgi:sensor histidine kinase YesM
LGGLMFAWLSGGNLQQTLIYVLGNLASLAALLMFRMFGKERIRKDSFLAVTFAIAVQLLMQLGRAAMGSVFGYPTAAIIGFITTDILSILFTVFIVWTVRRIEGLFEDQRNYLLRIQREQQVERGEQF